jgi:Holliday junction resolvasome RuvABC endonuclease subunit
MIITGDILTLDLATHTGYAAGPFSERPQFGSHLLPSTGENTGRFIAAFDDWLNFMLDSCLYDLVVYEAPSLFAKTTPITVEKLNGLATHAQLLCFRRSIRCRSANASQVKKHFTGKGNAKKEETVARARSYGFPVDNDNEGDAIAVWHWALECYGTDDQKNLFRQMRFEGGMGVNQRMAF